MIRFEVKGAVTSIGIRIHQIRAADAHAAWERFQRAYSDRQCVSLQITSKSGLDGVQGGQA